MPSYTRIEASRAGEVCTKRDARANCPVVENGRRSGKPPTPQAKNEEEREDMGTTNIYSNFGPPQRGPTEATFAQLCQ